MSGYDLVVCELCGAAYADNIPTQPAFDAYYAAMSKYEPGLRAEGAVDSIFKLAAELIASHVAPSASITDVGCATGAFLAELKRRGYTKVIGFDPSAICCSAARRLHDIEVRPATISQLGQVSDRFNVVMSTGVLEHLCDVETSLQTLIRLLRPGGQMFIAVPDASQYHRWFGAPYQYFSMEHVNFFSPVSLSNLMGRHGFTTKFIQRVPRHLGPNAVEPVLMGLFAQQSTNSAPAPLAYDHETEVALKAYVAASKKTDQRIGSIIANLVQQQTPIYVWGTGTHTLRLLETSPLAAARIIAFIDSNRNYQGKQLHGIPVLAPEQIRNRPETVLVSSHVAEEDIKSYIQKDLKWTLPVVCLYEGCPVAVEEHK
jgi:SAM-dependent methyltransferase